MTTTTTTTLNRTATSQAGHTFSAYGPTANDLFTVWNHEDAAHVGWFERAEDAVDMMFELAGE